MSDDAIAAVLADGERLPREFVPTTHAGDDNLDGLPAAEQNSPLIGAGSVSALDDIGDDGPMLDPATSGEFAAGGRRAVPTVDAELAGPDWRSMAAPFLVGLLLGVVVGGAGFWMFAGRSAPTPTPTQATNPLPAMPAAPVGPPPETAEEVQELIGKLKIVSAKLEEVGGFVGGRVIVMRIKNDSGVVLDGATLAVKVSPAAFGDVVLAKETLATRFSPVLGLDEELEVRISVPGGGAIAQAPIDGPTRVQMKIIDVDWQGKDAAE